jgi:arachidonate 15-lipoxygenase (second type)/8-lipoxygenase (S-type)
MVPGMLENYTQDLLFSMERLSSNPYSLSRLNPSSDTIPFTVEDKIVQNLTGTSLQSLFTEGRLFHVDYSSLAQFTPIAGRYGGACSALFYIDPQTSKFLPLAVKTNVGSNLVYTPLDEPTDWLLAKIMFNVDDLWYTSWYHFASTHYVAELALEAAIRCMAAEHPVLAILQRCE